MQSVSSDPARRWNVAVSLVDEEGVDVWGGKGGWRTRKIWRGRTKRVDYPSMRRRAWWNVVERWRRRGGYGHRGGGGEDARMVVLCKGRSLINHGGPWVESVARVSRPEGREWSKEKRGGREGIGTINIVFATILGTSAERPALWASSRVGRGGRGWR